MAGPSYRNPTTESVLGFSQHPVATAAQASNNDTQLAQEQSVTEGAFSVLVTARLRNGTTARSLRPPRIDWQRARAGAPPVRVGRSRAK
jgi:hypothetical protein